MISLYLILSSKSTINLGLEHFLTIILNFGQLQPQYSYRKMPASVPNKTVLLPFH